MKNKAGRWVYVSAKVAPDTRLTIKQRLRKGSYFINWREGKTRRYEKAGKVLGEAVEQANRKLLQLQARVKGLDWHFGNAADPGRLTLREAIDAFLEELKLTHRPTSYELLIVDELGFVPLSKTGAELLFEMLSQRYERGSMLVTSNLPFQEWTEVLGSERLTGALLDRLTHHVHILEMNGDSYRLKQSRRKRTPSAER